MREEDKRKRDIREGEKKGEREMVKKKGGC